MILASAIKFHIEKTGETVVLCGCRHGDIFLQLKLLGFEPMKGYKAIVQGFITDKNQFLTRKEAFKHAKKCGQLSDNVKNEEIFSEDLW